VVATGPYAGTPIWRPLPGGSGTTFLSASGSASFGQLQAVQATASGVCLTIGQPGYPFQGYAAQGPARVVRHHSDPMFLGGAPGQPLVRLNELTHQNLHRDLNNFLRTREDAFGNHMRPQAGNSGVIIRQNFTRQQRLEALRDFYSGPGAIYTDAATGFFAQHPGL